MKSLIIWSCALLLCMAADTSAKALAPTSSTEETEVDMEKLSQTIEKLAHQSAYEGPYEVLGADFDHPHPVLTQDESKGKGKRVKRYDNDFDEKLFFICPLNEHISSISSYHDDYKEDRRFSINCKPSFSHTHVHHNGPGAPGAPNAPDCYESGWVNNFDQQFTFTCHSNKGITGIVSYHSNYHEDRRCCGVTQHFRSSCHWTSYVNNFDEKFDWNVPDGAYLAGVSSYHDNYFEDRRFKFYVCY